MLCNWIGREPFGDAKLKDQEIPEGHHVIGVYGNKTENEYISNFGFITVKYSK